MNGMLVTVLLLGVFQCIKCEKHGQDWSSYEDHVIFDERNVDEVLLENIMQKLDATSNTNKPNFTELLGSYLDGLMVRFRRQVFDLYKQMTCKQELCDPMDYLPFETEPLQSSSKLEVSSFDKVNACQLDDVVTSYCLFNQMQEIYVAVAYKSKGYISYHRLNSNGQCETIGQYLVPAHSCLLTLNVDKTQFVVVGPCDKNSHHANFHLEIYLAVNEGLDLLQIYDIGGLDRMLSLRHHGKTYLLLVLQNQYKEQNCHLYKWMGTGFEYVTNMSTNFGNVVKYFNFQRDTYIVTTDYTGPNSVVAIWQFMRNGNTFSMKLHQVLHDCETISAEPFTINQRQFLAVACQSSTHSKSYLYWWTGKQFLLWQTVPLANIQSWTGLKLSNDDTVMVINSVNKEGHAIDIFEFAKGYIRPAIHIDTDYSMDVMHGEIKVIQTSAVSLFTVLRIESGKSEILSYKLRISVKTEVNLENEVGLECLSDMKQFISGNSKKLNQFNETLEKLLNYSHSSSNTAMMLLFQKNEDFDETCLHFERKSAEIESKLNYIGKRFEHYTKFQQDSLLSDEVIVQSLTVLNSAKVTEVDILSGIVSGVPLDHLTKSVLSKTKDQVFDGPIIIIGGPLVVDSLVVKSMNGVRLQGNLAITSAMNIFSKKQQFENLNVKTMHLNGTVNGINLNDIVRKSGQRVIRGRKTFSNVEVLGNIHIESGSLSNINIESFAQNVLTTSGNQVISAHVTFIDDVNINGNLIAYNINGVNVSSFSEKFVFADVPQVITGLKQFKKKIQMQNIKLLGKLNGVDILKNLLTRSTHQVIDHDVTIKGNLNVEGDVHIGKTVNGMDLSDVLVTKCGDHIITGMKSFSDAIIVKHFETGFSNDHWEHYGDLNVDHLEVDQLNNVMVDTKLKNVLRKSIPQILRGHLHSSKVIFDENVVIGGLLNGGRLEDDYITLRTGQSIDRSVIVNGKLTTTGDVHLRDGVTVNDVDLSEFATECVTKDGDQIIHGHKVFHSIVVEKGFDTAQETADFVQHLQRRMISGDVLTISGNVRVKQNLKCGHLNDVGLSKFLNSVIRVDKHSVVMSDDKMFTDVEVFGDLEIRDRLNGVDVNSFFSRVVRLSTDQVISGHVKFLGPISCEAPVKTQYVNGRVLSDFVKQVVLADEHGKIKQQVRFRNGIRVNGGMKVEYLNKKHFNNFMSQVLLNHEHQELKGVTVVDGNMEIRQLDVLGKMNGIKISDLLLVKDDAILNASIIFKASVKFESLTVNGTFNLPNADDKYNFHDIHAKKVLLRGKLNHYKIQNLKSVILSKTRPQTFLNSDIHFENDVSMNYLNLRKPLVSGINLDDLRLNALTKSTGQIIRGKKTFVSKDSLVISGRTEIRGNLLAKNLPNFTHLIEQSGTKLPSDLFLNGGSINSSVEFRSKVDIKGRINNLKFPEDIVLLHSEQSIPHLHIKNDAHIDKFTIVGLVNGINLTKLVNNRITLSTNQVIESDMEFDSVLESKGLRKCHLSKSDHHTLLKDDNGGHRHTEHIWRDVVFQCPVLISGNIEIASIDSKCMTNLKTLTKSLTSIVHDVIITQRLPAARSIDHNEHNDSISLIVTTDRISRKTCNNVKALRCSKDVQRCQRHNTRFLNLPPGYIKDIRTVHNGETTLQLFLFRNEVPFKRCSNESNTEGVFLVIGLNAKNRNIFIPVPNIISIALFYNDDSNVEVVLIVGNQRGQIIGYLVNTTTMTYKNLGVLTTSLRPIDFIEAIRNQYQNADATLVMLLHGKVSSEPSTINVYHWKNEVKKLEYLFSHEMHAMGNAMVLFEVGQQICLAVATDIGLRVYHVMDDSLDEIQHLSQMAKKMDIIENNGFMYLAILTYEKMIAIYRWTDLVHFVLQTQYQADLESTDLHLFVLNNQLHLGVATSSRNNSLILKALTAEPDLQREINRC